MIAIMDAVQEWFSKVHTDPHIRANLSRLVRYHENGIELGGGAVAMSGTRCIG